MIGVCILFCEKGYFIIKCLKYSASPLYSSTCMNCLVAVSIYHNVIVDLYFCINNNLDLLIYCSCLINVGKSTVFPSKTSGVVKY